MFKNLFKNILKNKNILTISIVILIFLVVFTFSSFWFFYIFNKKIQNNYYDIKNKLLNTKANKEIIVVEIDEKTLNKLWRFPFDRKIYVPFINNLIDAKVWLIWFDIIFADRTNEDSDNLFSEAIKKWWNIVLWLSIWWDWSPEFPLDIFRNYVKTLWYFHPSVDRKTNTVYSITPYSKFKWSRVYENFAISILKFYYSYMNNKDYITIKKDNTNNSFYLTEKVSIPLSKKNKNEILINFLDRSKFTKVSFADVYDKNNFELIQKNIYFKNKIILVWTTAKWIKDIFYTPNGMEYGVYVHANMINTVLTSTYIKYFDQNLEWLIIFLLILLSVFLNTSRSGYLLISSNIAIISIFLIIFPIIVISTTNLITNYYIELIFSLIFSLIASNMLKYLLENINKEKLNKALWEYVSKEISTEILSWAWKINLDWENKTIVIFFSDIEWFTTISEKFSPEDLVKFLREYLWEMSNIIMDKEWFINKYEWDAIMALWWVFVNDKFVENLFNACSSAILQQKLLKKLNVWWSKRWFSEIRARMWLHCWPSIIWNIGAEGRKMEFTALWDSVNLASRLEWVNKFYGTFICVSEDVYEDVKEKFEFRYLDKIRVKWKNKPIVIYELLDFKWELTEIQKQIIFDFTTAIKLYLDKEFIKALEIFTKLEKIWDWPSRTYKNRCDMYINDKTIIWDSVWTMDSK